MALSNLLFSNNVVRNVTAGVSLTGDGTNVDVVNNSFYGGTSGVDIQGTLDSGKIINNALDGNTSDGTGFFIGTVNSSVVDYNDVYGYSAAYGGDASGGANSFTTDPNFVSGTDLKIAKGGSDCIDSGAGSGTYAEVPAVDYRDQSRPVDIPGFPDVDNGTDIGAYEMLVSELFATTYYVNASGSNIAPYADVASGAHSIETVNTNVTLEAEDIIEVVDNGVIDNTATTSISVPVTIRSWSGNTNKPTIKVNDANPFMVYSIDQDGPKIQNLKIYRENSTAAYVIGFAAIVDNAEISGCEFWANDVSSQPADVPVINHAGTLTDATIENNDFRDFARVMTIGGPVDGLTFNNNNVHDLPTDNSHCIFSSQSITNLVYTNNTHNTLWRGIFASGSSFSNVTMTNNVFRDMYSQTLLFVAGTLSGLDVINNTFRTNPAHTADVVVIQGGGGGTVDSKILNNIVDGGGSASVGLDLTGNGTNIFDYNCIYGCTTPYTLTGAISAGSNFTYFFPYFASATDSKLSSNSPCIDSGVGSGTHPEVPATDIRSQARPIVISGYTTVDDGTDIGAYEMLASEAPFVNKSYFIDAGGSDTAPYDTLAKAASTLYELFNQSTSGNPGPGVQIYTTDFIEVSSLGGDITDDSPGGPNKMPACTIRAYSGNASRPAAYLTSAVQFGFQDTTIVSGIDFIKDGAGGSPSNSFLGPWPGASTLDGIEIINNSFALVNVGTHGNFPGPISFNGPGTVTNLIVKNNSIINNGGQGFACDWASPNAQIINNTFDAFYYASPPTIGVIFIANTADQSAGTVIVNNIINVGNDSAGYGIQITGVNLPAQDYNTIYGANTEYGGVATQGAHNIHLDPEFADLAAGDLKLSEYSPCLEAGAGSGTYSGRPSTDIRGVARPQDLSWPSVDDGTDIGAYEMLASEVGDSGDEPFNEVQGGGTYTVFPGSGYRGKIVFEPILDPGTNLQVRVNQKIGR